MNYYRHHVFICCNQRTNGEACCQDRGASQMLAYMKQRIKALGLSGKGQIRVNKAGCLGRCEWGPVLVIYPQETWYTFIDEQDIDEMIEQHLIQGQVVRRLEIQ